MMLIENATPDKIKQELNLTNAEKEKTPQKTISTTPNKIEPIPLDIPRSESNQKSSSKKPKMNRNSSMQEMLRKREYEIVPDKRIKMLKNNSARDIFDSCNTKKVSKNQEEKIITSMLERFNQYQKRYEEKNKQLKEKLEMNRTKELKFKPKLNNYCSVGTEKVKKENFLTRSDNFIKQKNKKTEMIKKEREQKEKTYINPKLNKKEKLNVINKKLVSLFTWEENKKKKIESKKKEKIQKELSTCTFKPSITKKSIQLSKNGFNFNYFKPVQTEKKKNKSHQSNSSNTNEEDDVIAKAKLALQQSEFIQKEELSKDNQEIKKKISFTLERTADINISNNFNTLPINNNN